MHSFSRGFSHLSNLNGRKKVAQSLTIAQKGESTSKEVENTDNFLTYKLLCGGYLTHELQF